MCHAEWEFDTLKQALGAFDFVGTQLAECDTEIERQMQFLKIQDGVNRPGFRGGLLA